MKISVTILTRNSQKYLHEVLNALKNFDEVVLYDTGSNDTTISIAQLFPNVTIYQKEFRGFGPTHNDASNLARNHWILSIDSDEVVTPEMANEISTLKLDENCVYSFPRNNFFNKKWIKWCGWCPDRQIRLYHRKKTCFTNAQVHEAIDATNMKIVPLHNPFIHYSYETISDFLTKMQLYSDLFAQQHKGKKKSSLWKAISHGSFAFFKSYFIKKGFLGGYEGFVISSYNAHTAFYKYLKLYETNKKFKLK